ncbi:MAG: KH domain-containing protein [Leptospira sp.]|nr:KH domain-containing protein [Leptospira sp.]
MSPDGLIKYVVSFLVDKPDDVSINEVPGDEEYVLELRVAPEDIGKVIGKNGRIAKSLRTLLSAASSKAGRNYTLEIID